MSEDIQKPEVGRPWAQKSLACSVQSIPEVKSLAHVNTNTGTTPPLSRTPSISNTQYLERPVSRTPSISNAQYLERPVP
ncbi:MAG: hypothetical protein AAFV45_09515 [Pseudomonadota bacterium]